MRKYFLQTISLSVAFLVFAAMTCLGGSAFVTIGTGGITGLYYPAGNVIARLVNKYKKEDGIRATVESTAGSVFNINAVLKGGLEFGIVQSDRQYQAVNGLAEWEGKGPQKELRSVFSLHNESITLVAAVDSGIQKVSDLKGKRINIGSPGSGQRQNAIDVLRYSGLDYEKDLHTESMNAWEANRLLQNGRIDAFFYTVGHPARLMREATSGTRKVRFVSISGAATLLQNNPFYTISHIPADLYPGAVNDHAVPTIGVKATLVTSVNVPEDVVYSLTRAVFENLEYFTEQNPAFSDLTRESMLTGLSAPLHQGALRYYKETGLIR